MIEIGSTCKRDFRLGYHLIEGIRYHIALCCILNFLMDGVLGLKSGVLRSLQDGHDRVPCWVHYWLRRYQGIGRSWYKGRDGRYRLKQSME